MRLYKDTTYSVHGLVEGIKQGRIALPELQRPFVWNTTQVRDLFDSMYRGYPVGYLLFWEKNPNVSRRAIGDADVDRAERLIIDGQQRTTALYAVLSGEPVLRKDYSRARITIAFRPGDERFEVANAATRNDPGYITDISRVFAPDYDVYSETTAFLNRLQEHQEVTDQEKGRISRALHRLHGLDSAEFKVIELSAEASPDEVSKIFVRINSAGTPLNRSDFVLTMMSVYRESSRQELERFCAATRTPTRDRRSTPFNWHLYPKPAAMLRGAIAFAFCRARLEGAYALLIGNDTPEGVEREERIVERFDQLAKAQDSMLNLLHWHEFFQCLELAGFRDSKMITSDNTVVFSYVMWLFGRLKFGLSIDRLRHLIARWFFMAHMTSRYSGSFETRFERELRQIDAMADGDAAGFEGFLSRLVNEQLTADWWSVTLPSQLETSGSQSPTLSAYIAALNILDADALFSKVKVRARLDPSVSAVKGIERHHLFPRNYLKNTLNVSDSSRINQIANMSLVDWADNIAVSDRAPAEYWPLQIRANRVTEEDLRKQVYWHALPEGWVEMPYDEFLVARRQRMAEVIRDAFDHLAKDDYAAAYPRPESTVSASEKTIADLIIDELLFADDRLFNETDRVEAVVREDGCLLFGGKVFDGPDAAAEAAAGAAQDGWTYWSVGGADNDDEPQTLSALRSYRVSSV
jgi:hypothetical protein